MLKIAIKIIPGVIEYNPDIARKIVEKLSFGMDSVDTWNVDQAPNDNQLRKFIKENKNPILANMTQTQRENLFKWVLKTQLYQD